MLRDQAAGAGRSGSLQVEKPKANPSVLNHDRLVAMFEQFKVTPER